MLSQCLPPFPAARIIEVRTPRKTNTYYFCPNGTARVDVNLSKLLNHRFFGTYEANGEQIRIVWNREIGSRGSGRPFNCDTGCMYPNYKPFQNYLYEEEVLNLQQEREQGTVLVQSYNGGVCDPFWR